MKVGFHRVACERLQRGFCAQRLRRPVDLGIDASERTKQGTAHRLRQPTPDTMFAHMPAITAVAGEALVTPVAGQRDNHALAGDFAHAVGWDRGTVGERLVIHRNERVE